MLERYAPARGGLFRRFEPRSVQVRERTFLPNRRKAKQKLKEVAIVKTQGNFEWRFSFNTQKLSYFYESMTLTAIPVWRRSDFYQLIRLRIV